MTVIPPVAAWAQRALALVRPFVLPVGVLSLAAITAVVAVRQAPAPSAVAAEGAPAAGASQGGVLLAADAPERRWIALDTVRLRTSRLLPPVPAQLAWNEARTVRVTSPLAGRIVALLAQPGQSVSAGTPLARIASGEFAQVGSDLARAEAEAERTRAGRERADTLFAHGVIARKDLEQSRSDAAQALAEAERARARARQVGAQDGVAGEFTLRSPIAGVVVDRAANPGMEVRPDNGAVLFTISDTRSLWLTAQVPQADVPGLAVGDSIFFASDASPGTSINARVDYVAPALDVAMRAVTVRATLNGARGATPQATGSARIARRTSSRVPAVSAEAVVTEGSERVVYVVAPRGRFERRVVTVGEDDGRQAEITGGLGIGEVVVARGAILVQALAAGH